MASSDKRKLTQYRRFHYTRGPNPVFHLDFVYRKIDIKVSSRDSLHDFGSPKSRKSETHDKICSTFFFANLGLATLSVNSSIAAKSPRTVAEG